MPSDTAFDVVHPLTVGGEKYGCNNDKPRRSSYLAVNRRYFPDGSFDLVSVRVPVVTSTKCHNFYLWDTDPKCKTCPREKCEEYASRMKEMK